MFVYKNILVAIDCSEVDTNILNHVSPLALKLGASLSCLLQKIQQ